MRITPALVATCLIAACGSPVGESKSTLDLANFEIIDLTHSYGPAVVYWPTETKRFQKHTIIEGEMADGQFVSAFDFSVPEHTGTHLDAPYHFNKGGAKSDAVPLVRLIAPAVVINIQDKSNNETDYRLKREDIADHEAAYGRIAAGLIVLLRTGWSKRWPDGPAYLGGDDATNLHFPSFGVDAVRFLIEERDVAALGVDAASTDYGQATTFPVHRMLGAANVPSFEKLKDLDRLPTTGAYLIALPIKIEGGSGGPLRAVALVPL